MKQSTRKTKTLSLVPSAPMPADSLEQKKAAALNDSFEGWLTSVAPTLLQSSVKDQPTYRSRRSLTSTDIIRVNRATVRESTDHRHWPPDVVISFLEADVIKRTKKQ